MSELERQIDRHRQRDKQTETERQRQTDRQTDRWRKTCVIPCRSVNWAVLCCQIRFQLLR